VFATVIDLNRRVLMLDGTVTETIAEVSVDGEAWLKLDAAIGDTPLAVGALARCQIHGGCPFALVYTKSTCTSSVDLFSHDRNFKKISATLDRMQTERQSVARLVGDFVKTLDRNLVHRYIKPLQEWCNSEDTYAAETKMLCVLIGQIPRIANHLALRRRLTMQVVAIQNNRKQCLAVMADLGVDHKLNGAIEEEYTRLLDDMNRLSAMLTLAGFMSLMQDPVQ